mgnify:CR=1 FL=1
MNTHISISRVIAACMLALGALPAAQAVDSVVDPNQPIAGFSQLQLSEQWWNWALSSPAASNPLLDTTGASAGTNNTGPVYFLGGNLGGISVRSFNVPTGKPVFFPLVNVFDAEVPNDPTCGLSCALGQWLDSYNVQDAVQLHATLDGKDLLLPFGSANHRQRSTAFFPLYIPADNVFGFTAPYVGTLAGVSDGYWVGLDGLSIGKHTFVFGGTLPNTSGGVFTVEVVDFTNAVPEPETYAMLLAGLGTIGWVARRRRTTAAALRYTHNICRGV